MADTTSPLLGLLLMGTGGDNNAWGTNLNNQVFTLIENAIAGVTSLSVSGGSHTLTATESRSATIGLSGTLSASQILIVPSTAKKWTFINQCVLSGFEVQVQTASGALRNLPGGWTEILSDGTGALSRQDGHLVGEFFYSAAATPPGHALECNGAVASRTLYADLFAKIGTTWGAGDGFTTFGLPNGEDTGRFLRSDSATEGFTVGTYQSNTAGPHVHGGATFSGTTSGQSADHAHSGGGTTATENQSHNHGVPASGGNTFTGGGEFSAAAPLGSGTSGTENQLHTHNFSFETNGTSNDHAHNFSGTTAAIPANTGTTETRPESLVGLLCIRY